MHFFPHFHSKETIHQMGSQLHSPTPQILSRIPTKKPTRLSPFPSSHPNFRMHTIKLSSSLRNQRQPPPIFAATVTPPQRQQLPGTDAYDVKFTTLGGCKLGISRYPDFEYNAEGGTGTGTGTKIINEESSGEISVSFDVETLYIPPLTSATTRFLGLALPPFLRIDIVPQLFGGIINQKSGKVDLEFKAKFLFSIGSIYRAPPLLVETVLTSEESKGTLRSGKGERLNEEGKCRLVGVATVDPIGDFLMDSFLALPTECLANLNASIAFSSS